MTTGLWTARTRRENERCHGRSIVATFCLLLALGVSAAESPKPRALLPAKVTKVNDGDSLEVMLDTGAGRVRLFAIDTPEHDQPHGAESSAALKSLLPVGSAVELEIVTRDQFRRIVAIVWRMDAGARTNVNEKMLSDGHAWAYRRYMADARFCDIEADARDAKRGLWSRPVGDWVYPPEWRLRANGEIRALPAPYVETRATCAAVLALAGAATY
jgi:endonuclease YncB( thermonuclease family)